MRDQPTEARGAVRAATRRLWRPGLIDLYLLRSLAGPFLLALGIALMAMMLDRALSLAQEMAAAGAHLRYFLPLLAWIVPTHLGLAMPAALMIALMFLVARLDESVELEAMLAGGLSFARIAAPLAGFSLLVAAAGLAGTGWLEPWGRYEFRTLKAEALREGDVGNLQPGAFYQPADGLTFGFERRAGQGRVEGLFVRRELAIGRELVATAPVGSLRRDADGTIELVLAGGATFEDADPRRRYGAYSLGFSAWSIRQPGLPDPRRRPRGSDQKELTLVELARELATGERGLPRAAVEAEMYGRLARPLSALLLPFLAIPLGFAAKKGRRGLGIALGAAIVVAFHHLVNLVKDLTAGGSLASPTLAFGLLCAGFGAATLGLFVASRFLPSHSPLTDAMDRLGLSKRRKSRAASIPGAGTLGAYVAANFALWTAASAATLVLILQMVDLFEHGDDFVARGFGAADMAYYAALRLPLLLGRALPLAALIGAIVEVLRLGRFSEMLAIRAAGISLPRIVLMMLPVAVLLSLAGALLEEAVMPRSEAAFAAWWQRTAPPGEEAPERWFRIGGEIVRARLARDGGLADLTLYRVAGGRLRSRVEAASAVPAPGGWRLSGVRSLATSDGPARTHRAAAALWRTPLRASDLPTLFAPTPALSVADARRALAGTRPVEEGPARFLTRLQRLFSAPLAPFVMLLLAAPLAVVPAHRSLPAWRLLYPLLGGMAFIVADGLLTVIAGMGMIPPWLGAWAAPVLFGLLALTVLVYTEA